MIPLQTIPYFANQITARGKIRILKNEPKSTPMKLFLLYIDPGSGSYLLQIIIAGVLAVFFYFRNAWLKVKSVFKKKSREDPTKTDVPND